MLSTLYSDMITSLNTAYATSKTVLDSFRQGTNTQALVDNGKAAVQQYKDYATKRLLLEQLPAEKKKHLETILNDLGESPIFIERNISLIRIYITVTEPDYIEP